MGNSDVLALFHELEIVKVDVKLADDDELVRKFIQVPENEHKPVPSQDVDWVDWSKQTRHHLFIPLQVSDCIAVWVELGLDLLRAFKLRDEVSIAADLEVLLQLCVLDFDGLLVLLVERHESLLLTSGKSKISDVESFQS